MWKHKKSDYDHKFGIPDYIVRRNVIRKGLADFTEGYTYGETEISAKQVCQLYCFFNMKRHFFEALSLYRTRKRMFAKMLSAEERTVFIDVGCGAATAGLAFCDLFPSRRFLYVGIDRALSMIEIGKTVLKDARTRLGAPTPHSAIWKTGIGEIPVNRSKECNVVLNFSYFFASNKLPQTQIQELAQVANRLVERGNISAISVVYLNTVEALGGRKYAKFLQLLGFEDFDVPVEKRTIYYRRKRGGNIQPVEFRGEVFKLK